MSLRSLVLGVTVALATSACGPQTDNDPFKNVPDVDMALGNACPHPPADTDGDHISDDDEGKAANVDTDGDGIPDYRDPDSDNDGIPDAIEGRNGDACTPPVDTDKDGKPDFRDLDSDDANDSTIPDRLEAGPAPATPVDTNHDGKPDYMDVDDDGDGIPDILELTPTGKSIPASTIASAPDTDEDGTPDYLDLDSDDDTIADADEHSTDVDGDFIPNYRDHDSDGDCVPDALEAGDDNVGTPPVDTDGDGTPDFVDVDSDDDGLVDRTEDKNCDGQLDACETNRLVVDTDGDGVSDLVEVTACEAKSPAQQAASMCQCDGDDAQRSPTTEGDVVFVVDYQAAPSPTTALMSFANDVHQADVVFALDTTSSMAGCIGDLSAGLATLVSQAQAVIPDVAFGVYEFRDLGTPQMQPSGTPANLPSFEYDQRLETVSSTGLAAVQSALDALSAKGGGDGPEAGWSALYTIATTLTRTIDVVGTTTTYLLSTTPTAEPTSTGETGGTIGGAGFRPGSVPVVVTVSDAEWHDAPGSLVAADPESGLDMYPSTDGHGHPACNPCTNVPSRREAISALSNIGAHVIGLAALGGLQTGNPKERAVKVAQETGAVVTPSDFGPVGTRPSACALTQCCTGQNGAGEASQAGTCPLAFSVDADSGRGVASSVLQGLVALVSGLRFDVHVEASDIDANAVESFMLRVVPDTTGMGAASLCVTTPGAPLEDDYTGPFATPGPDGFVDTFPGLVGGQLVCFDVVPKMNDSVSSTSSPQVFRAQLQVKGVSGAGVVNLGVPRQVYFLVPPKIVNPPVY